MREVSGRILLFALDLARTGEIDVTALLHGLPSVASRNGVSPTWFDWDDFIELWERLERALGGPEGFARVARLCVPTAYPEFRAFAAVLVSPISLFRYMMLRHSRTSFRVVDVEELECFADGRIRWRETIQAPYRGSEAFHRTSRTIAALIPMHLDLPPASAEITSMTARTAEFIATFPQPPLSARGRNAVSAATAFAAAQLEAVFERLVERPNDERPSSNMAGATPSVSRAATQLELSPRQREVFALVLEGRANKAIAHELGCSERNVEFHVGRILRAAQVTSRAQLLVKVLAAEHRGGT